MLKPIPSSTLQSSSSFSQNWWRKCSSDCCPWKSSKQVAINRDQLGIKQNFFAPWIEMDLFLQVSELTGDYHHQHAANQRKAFGLTNPFSLSDSSCLDSSETNLFQNGFKKILDWPGSITVVGERAAKNLASARQKRGQSILDYKFEKGWAGAWWRTYFVTCFVSLLAFVAVFFCLPSFILTGLVSHHSDWRQKQGEREWIRPTEWDVNLGYNPVNGRRRRQRLTCLEILTSIEVDIFQVFTG